MRLAAGVALVFAAACHHGSAPPPAPDCAHVADHVQSLLGKAPTRAIHDVFLHRCVADLWPDDARACFVDEPSLHGGHHCKDRLAQQARDALDRDVAALAEPPAACAEYTRVYKEALACAKLSSDARQFMTTRYEQVSAQWTRGDRAAIDKLCDEQRLLVLQTFNAQACNTQ